MYDIMNSEVTEMKIQDLKKIREDKGDWGLVYYTYSGASCSEYCCTKADWEIMNMFQTLVSQGADEKLLSDFQSAVYSHASDEAERDFQERE
jgi:hypothetical protein